MSVRRGLRSWAMVGCASALAAAQGSSAYRAAMRRLVGNVRIREAGQADLQALRARRSTAGHPQPGPHVKVRGFVAEGWAGVLGWVYLQENDCSTLWPGYMLAGLYVRARWRRLGLGRRLAQAAVAAARDEGAAAIRLSLEEDNQPARRIYETLGWAREEDTKAARALEESGRRSGRPLVLMRLDLDQG